MSKSGEGHPVRAGTLLASCLLFLFVLFNPSFALGDESPLALEIGQSVTIEAVADDSPRFSALLEEDKTYLFRVDNSGFEYKVEVLNPTGESATFNFPTFADYPLGRDEIELLLIESTTTGQYVFTLVTNDFTGAVATPRVMISAVDPGERLLPAYRLMTNAARVYADMDWQSALNLLKQTVPLLDHPADASLLGRCYFAGAIQSAWQGMDFEHGIEWSTLAETAYRNAGQDLLAATAQVFRAGLLVDEAHEIEKSPTDGLAPEAAAMFDEALSILGQALEVQQREGRRFDTAGTLNMLGYSYYLKGEYQDALEHYTLAAEEFSALKEWGAETYPLSNKIVIDYQRGYLIRSANVFARILEIVREGDMLADQANQLDNLGGTYLALGELDRALTYFTDALEIHEETELDSHKGRSVHGIGDTYLAFGETELGMEYLEAALPMRRNAKHGPGLVALLNALGRQYLEMGNPEAALAAHIDAQQYAINPRDKASTLLRLSEVKVATGEQGQALELLSQAEMIAEDMGARVLQADVLKARGETLLSINRHRDALDAYHGADSLYEELGLAIERSEVLHGISRSHSGLSQGKLAVQFAVQAIDTVEDHRASLITPQMRAFFMAKRQDYYTHLIASLIALQATESTEESTYIEQALSYSERSRARALVDLIHEAGQTATRTGQSEERAALLRAMADARHRLSLVKQDSAQRQKDIDSTRRELADIENRLNLLEIERRRTDPAYANLADPTVLDASGIQAMLAEDQALLQYTLGREQGFVFLVTHDDVRAWPIAGTRQLEQEARVLYEQLKVPSNSRKDREQFATRIAEFARLVLPPADALNKARLLVVADGVLQYLPFSVLLAANGGAEPGKPLSGHEVVNVPSMSVLAGQRQVRAGSPLPDKVIAIFADPVFSASDKRVSGLTHDTPGISAAVAARKPSDPSEPRDLERLPATAYESDNIAQLVAPGGAMVHTGFEANRDVVIDSDLSEFRVVHFATHGKIDSRYPALSWLAFSQIDSSGMEQNGLVRLHDIYNLDLNAELVTMSACDTALGREISGEGLTGLVQGFMYSGARSVLASLWQVPDRATAELMGHFYRNLFEKEQKPAEALRNAQLALSSQARWRHPYFWSAFVLQGDWE